MINTNATYINVFEEVIISVITEDTDMTFMNTLSAHNFKVHLLDKIPEDMDSWGISPDTVVLDSIIDAEWEMKLEAIQEIEAYKHIPIIVLTKNEVQEKEIFSTWDKDFLYIHRENSKSILRAIIASVKSWKRLNNSLLKTNQLNRILSTNYLVLDAKNECLESVQKQIELIDDMATPEIKKELTKLNDMVADNLKKGYHYQLFKAHFEEVHPLFFKKLLAINKDLSNNDLKLASFLKMSFNNSEISFFMSISIAGVKKAIQRLRIKLGLSPKESLRQYLFTIEA